MSAVYENTDERIAEMLTRIEEVVRHNGGDLRKAWDELPEHTKESARKDWCDNMIGTIKEIIEDGGEIEEIA